MATIDNFKNHIIKTTRPNYFEVVGSFPLSINNAVNSLSDKSRQFTFLCRAASIPGQSISSITVPFQGRQLFFPGDKSFPEWELTVLNDGSYFMRELFEQWHELMSSTEEITTTLNPNQDIFQDWNINQLDVDQTIMAKYRMISCFPTELGQIELNHDLRNVTETFTVTMRYQYWKRV